jgi:hypothetical protein
MLKYFLEEKYFLVIIIFYLVLKNIFYGALFLVYLWLLFVFWFIFMFVKLVF